MDDFRQVTGLDQTAGDDPAARQQLAPVNGNPAASRRKDNP